MSKQTVVRSTIPKPSVGTEAIHVRNYDDAERVLTIRVSNERDRVFDHEYHLAPRERVSERHALPPGVYDVVVELGDDRQRLEECTVGLRPEHTILVETGNGRISVSDGIVR